MTKYSERHKHGGLGKYFTKEDVAGNLTKLLFEFLCSRNLLNSFEMVIEPSAGAGSFLKPMKVFEKQICALDIEPASPEIQEKNFLEFKNATPALYFGNPPFGHAAHLAVRFFNHASANGAQIIAFILPQTFRKSSVQDRLDRSFHLVREHEVPARAFLLDGREHDVPCIFQIWIKSNELRTIQSVQSSAWIEFTHPHDADYAMRRVGRRAGDLLHGTHHNRSTTHFFKVAHPKVLDILDNNDEIKTLRQKTSGVYSISKSEIYGILDRRMSERNKSRPN